MLDNKCLLCITLITSVGCVRSVQSNYAPMPSPLPFAPKYDAPHSTVTVFDVAQTQCNTSGVYGLSQQIIDEGRCMVPDAYVEVPRLNNVTFGSNVFAYLERPARDHLVAALQFSPNQKLTIHSMLRTVAQQYLIYSWYTQRKCNIELAAKPGNSNHETGLAMDVREPSEWKTMLANFQFKWFGERDRVHFDYVGSDAVNYKGVDVASFQRLWNRNHPEDRIAESGTWNAETETRMKQSPASGFAQGSSCIQ